ncbi:response regulator, lytTr family protein [Pandoraea terrae]|uniref:Response regulator, lytTr family protein n=1 Tax=Pandoraea terrae TaxID=1537710 RepID=A0A5E4WWU9_9BURK|nr:LytTR family DNA-binding domain-containing protein [Pandoraea terrae]VVE27366.1 response regulator, lytTr family protein [Pandoraea terrae]
MTAPLALIAEDEPLLAASLHAALAQAWPELRFLPAAADGVSAIASIAASQPDIVFLDIAMPGATGLDVARACAALSHPPQIVFVTAYDRFALDAFDAAAVDYLLKPVEPARLAQTVARLRARLATPDVAALDRVVHALARQWDAGPRAEKGTPPGTARETNDVADYLRYVRASIGGEIRIVPVEDVCYFEAADKYVTVATPDGDLLIRTSLRELLPQLDPNRFWQVHRSTLVNVADVVSAQHSPLGRMTLKLRRRKDRVAVSRQYAHLFRQM